MNLHELAAVAQSAQAIAPGVIAIRLPADYLISGEQARSLSVMMAETLKPFGVAQVVVLTGDTTIEQLPGPAPLELFEAFRRVGRADCVEDGMAAFLEQYVVVKRTGAPAPATGLTRRPHP